MIKIKIDRSKMVEDIKENKKMVGILDLFKDQELVEKSDGNYKTICPDCGLQGGRTKGFILFPDTNMAYCHSSGKTFNMLESYALKKKVIKCIEGRDPKQKEKILNNEQISVTLDYLEEEFDKETFNELLDIMHFRREIELPGDGKLISEFAEEIGDVIKEKNEIFYREDIDEVVEIKNNIFKILNPAKFITLVERYFKPWSWIYMKNGTQKKTYKSMTQQIAKVVLLSNTFVNKLKKIKRIFNVPMPIIYNNKLTFPKIGYDKRFESWLNTDSPEIDENIDIETAKNILDKIYHEFCFEDEQDRVNAYAGLITPFLRGLFSNFNVRTPMFCYIANRERAGKDYCAGITGLVLEGYSIEEPPISAGGLNSTNSEELRKKLTSALISGKRRLHFANNKGRMNNAVLEGFLTSNIFSDRLLGKNDNKNFDNEIDVSMSGNIGISFTPDLANRSRFINLFLDIEDANLRKFKEPNLHEWVKNNRGLIISSIYSLIKNWFNNKCPKSSENFASFPEWAEICGGILESADIGNPCKTNKENDSGSLDNETSEMKLLFETVYEISPEEWINKSKIKEIVSNDSSLMPYLDLNEKADQTKFGLRIDKFVGRILSEIKLMVKDKNIRSSRREYKFTKNLWEGKKKPIFDEKKIGEIDEKVEKIAEKYEKTHNFDENKGKFGNLGNLGNLYIPAHVTLERNKVGGVGSKPYQRYQKHKSDRQTQFYETEECQDIKQTFTKEELEKWIKENPKHTDKELYDKFGVGCFKVKEDIINGRKE